MISAPDLYPVSHLLPRRDSLYSEGQADRNSTSSFARGNLATWPNTGINLHSELAVETYEDLSTDSSLRGSELWSCCHFE
jgi:hypothetical protein